MDKEHMANYFFASALKYMLEIEEDMSTAKFLWHED
jgi:hypothetical protein